MEKIFTDKTIRSLKYEGRGKAARFVQEAHRPGFGIRIYPSGAMTFAFRYKFDGKEKYLALGKVNLREAPGETTGLVEARKAWHKAYLLHTSGVDPDEEKATARKQRLEDQRAKTISQLAEDYLADLKSKGVKETIKRDEDYLRRVLIPALGKLKAKDVTPVDINDLLKKYATVGVPGKRRRKAVPAPIAANRCATVISMMFKYGVEEGVIEVGKSPDPYLIRPGMEATPSDRILSVQEIRYLWGKLTDPTFTGPRMNEGVKTALLLTLLTGQRSGEVLAMGTTEVNGHDWTIPGDVTKRGVTTKGKTKNNQEQYVYLTDTALEILHSLPARNGYFFAKRVGWRKCPTEYTAQTNLSHAVLYCIRDGLLEMEPWTPHDLRATPATMLSTLGVPDTMLERLLNHKLPGVLDRYNRNKFKAQKKLLLLTWEHLLKQIISGEIDEVEFNPAVWEQFLEWRGTGAKVINLQQRRASKDPAATLLGEWQQAVLQGERRGFDEWCLDRAQTALN